MADARRVRLALRNGATERPCLRQLQRLFRLTAKASSERGTKTDAVAQQAQAASLTAFNVLAGLSPTVNLTGQDLGTVGVLSPGVYFFSSSAQLTGSLTLDFGANPDQPFVFQIGTTLTTGSASTVNEPRLAICFRGVS